MRSTDIESPKKSPVDKPQAKPGEVGVSKPTGSSKVVAEHSEEQESTEGRRPSISPFFDEMEEMSEKQARPLDLKEARRMLDKFSRSPMRTSTGKKFDISGDDMYLTKAEARRPRESEMIIPHDDSAKAHDDSHTFKERQFRSFLDCEIVGRKSTTLSDLESLELFVGLIRSAMFYAMDELDYWLGLFREFAPENINTGEWETRLNAVKEGEAYETLHDMDLGTLWLYEVPQKQYVECGYFDDMSGLYYVFYQRTDGETLYEEPDDAKLVVRESDVITALSALERDVKWNAHEVDILHTYYDNIALQHVEALVGQDKFSDVVKSEPTGIAPMAHNEISAAVQSAQEGPKKSGSRFSQKGDEEEMSAVTGAKIDDSKTDKMKTRKVKIDTPSSEKSGIFARIHKQLGKLNPFESEVYKLQKDKAAVLETTREGVLLPHTMYNTISLLILTAVVALILQQLWCLVFLEFNEALKAVRFPLKAEKLGTNVNEDEIMKTGAISLLQEFFSSVPEGASFLTKSLAGENDEGELSFLSHREGIASISDASEDISNNLEHNKGGSTKGTITRNLMASDNSFVELQKLEIGEHLSVGGETSYLRMPGSKVSITLSNHQKTLGSRRDPS